MNPEYTPEELKAKIADLRAGNEAIRKQAGEDFKELAEAWVKLDTIRTVLNWDKDKAHICFEKYANEDTALFSRHGVSDLNRRHYLITEAIAGRFKL